MALNSLPFPSDYYQHTLEVEGSGVIPALQSGTLARSISSQMILIVTEQIPFNLRMKTRESNNIT